MAHKDTAAIAEHPELKAAQEKLEAKTRQRKRWRKPQDKKPGSKFQLIEVCARRLRAQLVGVGADGTLFVNFLPTRNGYIPQCGKHAFVDKKHVKPLDPKNYRDKKEYDELVALLAA